MVFAFVFLGIGMSKKNLSVATLLTGLGTLMSRVLGLLRDVVFSAVLGTGEMMGTFVLALTVPNMSRRIFGEGALSASFLPLLSDELTESKSKAERFSGNIIAVQFLILSCLSILIGVGCVTLNFFIEEKQLFWLIAAMLPYMVFICMTALLSGILNLYHSFLLPSMSSMILNILLIASALLGSYLWTDQLLICWSLVGAVLMAGIIQAGMLYAYLLKKGFSPKWNFNWRHESWQKVWTLFIPGVIGASVAQIGVASDRLIAGYLGRPSVASLYFSERLVYLPVGLFGVALGTVCLPMLSRAVSEGKWEEAYETLTRGVKIIFLLTIPCTLFFALYGEALLFLLFKRGQFTDESLAMTKLALFCYIPGIPFFCLVKVLLPFYYAQKDVKTPLKIAWICLVMNVIVGLSLIPWLSHASLALATSASSALNVTLLATHLKGEGKKEFRKSLKTLSVITFTAIISYIGIFLMMNELKIENFGGVLFQLVSRFGFSGLVFLILVYIFGEKDLLKRLRR
mgnify:CR=1 FL=1